MRRTSIRLASVLAVFGVLAVLASGTSARADDFYIGDHYNIITYNNGPGTSDVTVGGGSVTVSTLNGQVLPWVYCIGLYTDIYVPGAYNNTAVTKNGTVFGAAVHNAGLIAYWLDTYAKAAEGNANLEASLQGAIWHTEFGVDIVAGNAITDSLAQYNIIINNIGTANVNTIRWLSPEIPGSGTEYQPQVTIGTPEPSTLAIAGLSGLGLLLYARRRSR